MKTKLLVLLAVIASVCTVSCGYADISRANRVKKQYIAQMEAAHAELKTFHVVLTPEEEAYIVSLARAEAFYTAVEVEKEWHFVIPTLEERACVCCAKTFLTIVPLDEQKSAYAQTYVKMCTYWATAKTIQIWLELAKGRTREPFGDIPKLNDY